MEKAELAIVGAGLAGVSASIYAKRAGLSLKLFEKGMIGGQLTYINSIDNYIGIPPGTSSVALLDNLKESLERLDIIPLYTQIEKVEVRDKEVYLYSGKDVYVACALIIATGASFKRLGLVEEERFLGRGLSYCALCDGFFFKDKEVAVIGGGNTALSEAIYLSQLCKKVYLIHRRSSLRALDYLQKELFTRDNIQIIWDTEVREIRGKESLEELILEDTRQGKVRSLAVSGLFVAVGFQPNTKIFQGLVDMDEKGFIITDEEMYTSQEFILACGDCRKKPLRQLITAASEGAVAAISAYKYLRGSYIST
jgi:thioredoxin reductase (NADPH)